MAEVFVSYKAEDRARVRPIVEALQTDGLTVWWDADVGYGEAWRDTIARELDTARCVLVFWSKRSTGPAGHFVRDEAARGQRKGVYLPVRIDRVEPPLGFGETQALDLSKWDGSQSDPRYQGLLAGIHAILGREAPVATKSVRERVSRRTLIVGSGLALAAAGAGAGGWMALRPRAAKSDSIAVLPFANLSGDPAQAYFSDGIAEELRSALSVIAGLKVVARTSSELLRNVDAKTAASKLGVANVLTGSVRRSTSTIRVSAQLIEGVSGLERWSQSFDRPSGDVLEIQSDIAESVARALSVELAEVDRAVLTMGGTLNPEAQDLLLQAKLRRDDSETSLNRALALLDKAIALDPTYAEAHGRRAFDLNFWSSVYALSAEEVRLGHADAAASARRAISLAPRMALGYAALGTIYKDQLNIGAALVALQKADALPGTDVLTQYNYALALAQSGRQTQALSLARNATSLDPLAPISGEIEAAILFYGREYEQAIAAGRRTLQIAPERVRVRSLIGNALVMLNRLGEGARVYAGIEPNDYRRLVGEAIIAARLGQRTTAMQSLAVIKRRYGDAANYQYAQINAQLGRREEAIAALDEAWSKRDPGLAGILVDPFLDPVRPDPRLSRIAARLKFP